MSTFVIEMTKRIVVSVEAESYGEACQLLEDDAFKSDNACAWDNAEQVKELLDEEYRESIAGWRNELGELT